MIKYPPIIIPKGIRFISDWKDYSLEDYCFPHILDKKIPGCGYTEYCLTNNLNVILCSPRKILLENKESQHQGEIYYARNDFEFELNVDKDFTSSRKSEDNSTTEDNSNVDAYRKMSVGLLNYCQSRLYSGKPIKIIVTYDSFQYVRRFLSEYHNLIRLFFVVIDEFQSIFTDSRFKSIIEDGFIYHLSGLTQVCFVSATPMLDRYLEQIEYFKDLPYFEFDWETADPGRICKPELKIRKTKSIITTAKEIIQSYLDGNYEILADINGNIIQSKEVVIYVNSVNNIISIIKKMRLNPNQCNILCSNTLENQKRLLSKLGKGFKIGSVPLKGEPHKMFTLCTRTVYLGADFYSTNARTIILSDANIDSLAVDISLDLPQILGRQRLIENPWKNHAEFYFKTLGKDKILSKEDFNNRLKEKDEETYTLLRIYDESDMIGKKSLIKKYSKDKTNYKDDYVSIVFRNGNYQLAMNYLVRIAEQRAFDIQQIDYKDRFSVFTIIRSEGLSLDSTSKFIETLRDTSILFSERLKLLCETLDYSEEEKSVIASQVSISFDRYYNILGPSRCKALGYRVDRMNKEINDKLISPEDIKLEFYTNFKISERYAKIDAKETIRKIYSKLGITRTPKASDLQIFFEIKPVKTKSLISGKMENGFEILKIKEIS